MYYAVDFKEGKLGILNTSSKTVEFFTPEKIKEILKSGIIINGITLAEELNPIYTISGLKVNLAYRNHKKFGKWIVCVLKAGDKYGRSLSSTVNQDTVFFYDTSVDWNVQEYPYGQFVASYYLETILEHKGGLCFDAGVPSWGINGAMIESVKTWLRGMDSNCCKEEGPNMFKRLEETILNTIEKVFDEVCDFENWWQDYFETDYAFKTKEELDEFSENDLECIKCDWIQWISDVFVARVCNELGILFYDNNKTNSQEILIEELYEIVEEQLWERIK